MKIELTPCQLLCRVVYSITAASLNYFCLLFLLACSAHMQDLQEVTHEVHYENYRSERMASGGATRKIKFVVAHCFLIKLFEISEKYLGARMQLNCL